MGLTAVAAFTIVIRLYANTAADLAIVAQAQEVGGPVLEHAGLTPVWIVCTAGTPCERPIEGDILVRFLVSPRDGSRRCGTAAGTGLVPSGLVTLFKKCIDEGAERLHIPHDVVVGYSLVHEIGHLLFRRGHAMSGLMASEPDWRLATAGGLQFAPHEIEAIQHALAGSAPEREKRLAAAAGEHAPESAPAGVR